MPATLIATWRVRPGKEEEFVEFWQRTTADILPEEGLRRARLHRSRSHPDEFLNIAVWESPEHNRACATKGTVRAHRAWLQERQDGPDPILATPAAAPVSMEWLDLVTESTGGSGNTDFR